MPFLADTAQIIMNLYYQNYRDRTDFFKLHHFKYLAGSVVSKILEDKYKEAKKMSRIDDPSADVDLPEEWLIPEEAEVKRENGDNIITLKHQPFAFPFDLLGRTVQTIENMTVGGTCNRFIRINIKEKWKYKDKTVQRIFFYVVKNKIYLLTGCKVEKVKIFYVPEVTSSSFGEDGGPVPISLESDVIQRTWALMAQARQGTVVDMTNNSNPNKSIQTEIDTVFSNLRTKPI